MSFRPLWGQVLVKPLTEQKETETGIILPETVQNPRVSKGQVEATGSGSLAFDGSPIEMEVKYGDKIVYRKYNAEEIQVDGQTMFIVDQKDVLGVL